MEEQAGPGATLERMRRDLPELGRAIENLPVVLRRLGEKITDEHNSADNEKDATTIDHSVPMTGGAVMISGALLLGLGFQWPWLGWSMLLAGGALLALGRR